MQLYAISTGEDGSIRPGFPLRPQRLQRIARSAIAEPRPIEGLRSVLTEISSPLRLRAI